MLFALPLWPLALIIVALSVTISSTDKEDEDRGYPTNNLIVAAAVGILFAGAVTWGYTLTWWKGLAATMAYLATGWFIFRVKLHHWGIDFVETARYGVSALLYYLLWCVIKAPNIWASARDLKQNGIQDPSRERQHVALGLFGLIGLCITIPVMFLTWDGRWALAVAFFAYLYLLTTMAHFENERENEEEPISSQYR